MAVLTVCIGNPEEGNTKGMIVEKWKFSRQRSPGIVEKHFRLTEVQKLKDHEMFREK